MEIALKVLADAPRPFLRAFRAEFALPNASGKRVVIQRSTSPAKPVAGAMVSLAQAWTDRRIASDGSLV